MTVAFVESDLQHHSAVGPQRGFTLVELLIVVAVLAILASIAVPNLLSTRQTANESAAIATLKSIMSAQTTCQASGSIDADFNGEGEFGYFGELAGASRIRANGALSAFERLVPPALSAAFGQVMNGRVQRSGYTFQMYLPDTGLGWVSEAPSGGAVGGSVSAINAEIFWACFAWPNTYPQSGKRAFFVNQSGDVIGCNNSTSRYDGSSVVPVPGTFAMLGAGARMASTLALNRTGADGERWFLVN